GLLADSATVARAHEHLMHIVDTLMHKSRMDQRAEPMDINLNDFLRQELEFFNADSRFKHQVSKDYQFDPALPSLSLVYGHIAQVVENLLRNALDAMWRQSDPHLWIATRHDDETVYIDIRDNGGGIPADKLEAIFDPFFTTKPAKGEETDGEPTGTGLGLPTCLELLKPFGGTIRVKSKVGEGSTFTVVLPRGGTAKN
ncbi:MAG: HAMP domain-containing histidine kinase, partial [Phaeodactylibacter sp.]|nr:HAMP domain-containing histidine kinase [Phaeodactylibacter sp.]